MPLKSNDIELRLTIIGYEFPKPQADKYSSNSLQIGVQVQHPKESWSATVPCLMTWEITELATWFDALANGDWEQTDPGFLEPEIQFHLVRAHGQPQAIRVTFSHGLTPPSLRGTDAMFDGYAINFALTELDLRSAARSLRSELASYPRRARC